MDNGKEVQLSDVQFRSLLDAQVRFERASTEYRAAKAHLDLVSSLVFDAHQIPTSDQIQIDLNTKRLVVAAATE